MRIGAYVAIARGHCDAAVQLAQRAIARDRLDYWNYFALGAAHYSEGQMDAAETDYRKAPELNATADGQHYLGPMFMRNDPLQKNLQGDPRFTAFLQKMKLLQ